MIVGLLGLLSLYLLSMDDLHDESEVEGRASTTDMTTGEVGLGGFIISNSFVLSLRVGRCFRREATGFRLGAVSAAMVGRGKLSAD